MSQIFRQCKDDLGLITLKKFFVENGQGAVPKPGFSVTAKLANHCTLDPSEMRILNYLNKICKNGTNLPEIISKIESFIESQEDALTDVRKFDIIKLN